MEVGLYRIEFDAPGKIHPTTFAEALREIDLDHVEVLLESALKWLDSLKFTFARVTAKFGALKCCQGKDRFGDDHLLTAPEDASVYDEAVREVFHTDLTVAEAAGLLRCARDGDVGLVAAYEPTAIGIDGRGSGTDLLVPKDADANVIGMVRDRTRNDRALLVCLHRKDWTQRARVKRVRDPVTCPECDVTRVAVLSPWDEEMVKAVRTPEKNDERE